MGKLTTRYRVDGVAAAVIAETSCCRLRGAKGEEGGKGWERARGPRGGPQPGASCNEERRCTRARGTFDEAAIERTGQHVCTRRRCVDAGRAQMPTR